MKRIEFIIKLIAVLLMLGFIIFDISLWVKYGNKPVSEIPLWVLWFLW